MSGALARRFVFVGLFFLLITGSFTSLAKADCWSPSWTGYDDYALIHNFPTERPISIRIYYTTNPVSTWEEDIPTTTFYEGDEETWWLDVDGNRFEYFEDMEYFDHIDYRYGTTPEAPASISVPTEGSTGSYTVSWTASGSSCATYELQEATDSAFTTGLTTVVSGTTALSAAITDHAPGTTYYYRVRAVEDGLYSPWVNGANGCAVTEDDWTNLWTGYDDYMLSHSFPTERPICIRINFIVAGPWEKCISSQNYYEGDGETWWLDVDGNRFEYFEDGEYFDRIDVK